MLRAFDINLYYRYALLFDTKVNKVVKMTNDFSYVFCEVVKQYTFKDSNDLIFLFVKTHFNVSKFLFLLFYVLIVGCSGVQAALCSTPAELNRNSAK